MGAILDTISAEIDSYSRSTRDVARIVLDQPAKVISMSIVELAQQAGVSDPTVLRFARKLGFSGYKDFKRALADELPTIGSISTEPIEVGSDGYLNQLVGSYAAHLADMVASVNEEAFSRAVDVLRQATKVEFWGQCTSSTLAQDAYDKFFRAGVACVVSADADQQRLYSRGYGADDVIIAISHLGHNEEIARSLQQATALGATTISIATEDTVVSRSSSISITTKAVEQNPFNEMVMKASHVFIVDALALATASVKEGMGDPFLAI